MLNILKTKNIQSNDYIKSKYVFDIHLRQLIKVWNTHMKAYKVLFNFSNSCQPKQVFYAAGYSLFIFLLIINKYTN